MKEIVTNRVLKRLDIKFIIGTIIFVYSFFYLKMNSEFANFYSLYSADYYVLYAILIIMNMLKNIYNKIFVYFWLLWFLVGNFNMYYMYEYVERYNNIDTRIANNIYLTYLLVFIIVLFITEFVFTFWNKGDRDYKGKLLDYGGFYSNNVCMFVLGVFPVIGLAQMLYSVGYIPILQNKDVTDFMYKLNIGFINTKIGILGLFSAVYFYIRLLKEQTGIKRIIYIFVVLVDAFYMVALGARFRLLLFLICVLIMSYKYFRHIKIRNVVIFTVILCVIYLSIFIIRSGGEVNGNSIIDSIGSVGGEYRSWAISLTYLNGKKLFNYDWLGSSLTAFFGSAVFNLIGLDGDALSKMYSARFFAYFFNTVNGIRIGLIGELDYAYKQFGLVIFSIFSVFFGYVNNKILNSNKIDTLIFFSVLFSLNLLTVMGQSNTYFECLKEILLSLLGMFILILPSLKKEGDGL